MNGELVAIHEVTGEYHVFNEVGKTIWLCLAEGKSWSEAVDQVIALFGSEREQVEPDIDDFVQNLLTLSLIRCIEVTERE